MKKSSFFIAFICLFAVGLASVLSLIFLDGHKRFSLRSLKRSSCVAVIEVEGVIAKSSEIIKTLKSYREDDSIKAVVIRIDSPGGGVGPSQEIYEEVIKFRGTKPVVASMGSVAASGGYYIASAAHTIFANPGTITGSIGVIIEFANIEELLGKIGLKSVVVKSGKYKDMLSPVRELAEDERGIIQGVIDSIHNQFIEAVSLGRDMPREKIAEIADGRIFSGEQAKALGLVDELGNLEDALEAAAKRAGISGEPEIVYPEKKRPTLWDYVIEESALKLHELIAGDRLRAQYIVPAVR